MAGQSATTRVGIGHMSKGHAMRRRLIPPRLLFAATLTGGLAAAGAHKIAVHGWSRYKATARVLCREVIQ